MQALNLGSTIPTLAVLALAMSLLGIGVVPAIFGLWVASLLPIVRNTYAGMLGVPAHLRRGGHGHGDAADADPRPASNCPTRSS